MAKFITRVELIDSDDADYNDLHEEMESRGFSRTITSDDDIEYQLPDAEYYFSGVAELPDVRQKAKDAVAAIGKKGRILVTQSRRMGWSGLKKT
ncbi:hypothetical protein [Achromobacter aloeverae]